MAILSVLQILWFRLVSTSILRRCSCLASSVFLMIDAKGSQLWARIKSCFQLTYSSLSSMLSMQWRSSLDRCQTALGSTSSVQKGLIFSVIIFIYILIDMNLQKSKLSSMSLKKYRYSFEAFVDDLHINIKFPCKISLNWNYGEGQVKTSTPKQLVNNVAKFEEKISFKAFIGFDEDKQRYLQQRTTIEVSIITESGTNIAGFVYVDLGYMVQSREKKEIFDLERCPDKSAKLNMKLNYRYISDKPNDKPPERNEVTHNNRFERGRDNRYSPKINLDEFEHLPEFNRSTTPKSEYVPKTEYTKKVVKVENTQQYNKNKEIVERELNILKERIVDYEQKFKNERNEKQKLNELLKGKQEVYFTMKTQIKRKEIEVEDMFRSLEEYRCEYQRLKTNEESYKKQIDKYRVDLEAIEKNYVEKYNKLENNCSTLEKKYDKLTSQYERVKREKEIIVNNVKEKNEQHNKQKDNLIETVRVLKREKEEAIRNHRQQKEAFERNVRELNKRIKQSSETIQDFKEKLVLLEKKSLKNEELRNEEHEKNTLRINELEKIKQALSTELENLKTAIQKKELQLVEVQKGGERQLNEQRINSSKLKSNINDLQYEVKNISKQLGIYKENYRSLEEDHRKLDKQSSVMRNQILLLNEQITNKNSEMKAATTKFNELQEEFRLFKEQTEDQTNETVNNLQNRYKQLKKSSEVQYQNLAKTLTKKQKELEEAVQREAKCNHQLENAKEQLKKLELLLRDKTDLFKKVESQLKQELLELTKRNEKIEESTRSEIDSLSKELQKCQADLETERENSQKAAEREKVYKQELQYLQNCNTEMNNEISALRQSAEENEILSNDYEKTIDQLERELKAKDLREITLNKTITEAKEKLVDLENDRNKKESLLKEKQKIMVSVTKQYSLEIEDKKKELNKKETEFKNCQDEFREQLRKDKIKINEQELELQRLSSQHISLTASYEKLCKTLDATTTQLKQMKEAEKNWAEQRQQLVKIRQQSETTRRILENSKQELEELLERKDKEIRSRAQQLNQTTGSFKDLNKVYSRNNLLIDQVQDITARVVSLFLPKEEMAMRKSASKELIKMTNINEYEKLVDVRKGILLIETKRKKEIEKQQESIAERSKERERDAAELDKLSNEVNKNRMQLAKLKKQKEDLLYQINFLKIENQELLFKVQTLETDVMKLTNTCNQTDNHLKERNEELIKAEIEIKRVLEKYELLLEETRNSLSDKCDKQKKELQAVIRGLEAKVEQLEETNFNYELENQKISELTRRDEESRKTASKIIEIERDHAQQIQSLTEKVATLTAEGERLRWEKNNLEEQVKASVAKYDKNMIAKEGQIQGLTTKVKDLSVVIKDKDGVISKLEESINKLQNEFNFEKMNSKEDREKWATSDTKLKAQITKLKGQVVQLKKILEQERKKVEQIEELKIIKNNIDTELKNKEQQYTVLQHKQQKQSEELYKLKQKYQQLKWDSQQKLELKENEIMVIQEQLYAMNSKDNMRVLKQHDYSERLRQYEMDKKFIIKQLNDYKLRCNDYEDKIKMLLQQRQENIPIRRTVEKRLANQNERYEEQIRILEKESEMRKG